MKIQLSVLVLPSRKQTSSSSHRMLLVLAIIYPQNGSFGVKHSLTHSLTHSLEIIDVLLNIRSNIWYNKIDTLLTYVGTVYAYFQRRYLFYIYTELHCKVFLLDKL